VSLYRLSVTIIINYMHLVEPLQQQVKALQFIAESVQEHADLTLDNNNNPYTIVGLKQKTDTLLKLLSTNDLLLDPCLSAALESRLDINSILQSIVSFGVIGTIPVQDRVYTPRERPPVVEEVKSSETVTQEEQSNVQPQEQQVQQQEESLVTETIPVENVPATLEDTNEETNVEVAEPVQTNAVETTDVLESTNEEPKQQEQSVLQIVPPETTTQLQPVQQVSISPKSGTTLLEEQLTDLSTSFSSDISDTPIIDSPIKNSVPKSPSSKSKPLAAKIQIKVQKKSDGKIVTIIDGFGAEVNCKSLSRAMMKKLKCPGITTTENKHGKTLQLNGDYKDAAARFLIQKKVTIHENITFI
jgi:translation initiation factor 1 (eIF-1/SUI1)